MLCARPAHPVLDGPTCSSCMLTCQATYQYLQFRSHICYLVQ